jgi:hypothetical protein
MPRGRHGKAPRRLPCRIQTATITLPPRSKQEIEMPDEKRKRTEKELRENCLAREVTGASCQYPDCDCFAASDYYEEHPEEL